MTQISRRDFLRTAAALGLSAGALTIFEQACTTAEILTATSVPAPLPTSTRAAAIPPVTTPTRMPTAMPPPVATTVANAVPTSLPTATRPPTPTLTPVPAATATPPPTLTPAPAAAPTPQPTATPSPTAAPAPPSPTPEPIPRPRILEDPRMRMGHLLRRAGFGANEEEMDRFLAMGEDATVENLIEYETVEDSAREKLESIPLEGRYSPARRRLKRIKPGYYNPPGGPPVFVPGLNWLTVMISPTYANLRPWRPWTGGPTGTSWLATRPPKRPPS